MHILTLLLNTDTFEDGLAFVYNSKLSTETKHNVLNCIRAVTVLSYISAL